MLFMADKKKTGRVGRPPGRKATVAMQARVSPDIYAALEKLVAKTRRSRNMELVIALEQHLASHGLWPPEPAKE